jgi:hypothetical protein
MVSSGGAVGFFAILAFLHWEQGSAFLYDFWIFPCVYLAILVMLADFMTKTPRKRTFLVTVLVGILIAMGMGFAFAPGQGYPAQSVGESYTLTCTTGVYSNSTYTYSSTVTGCNSVDVGTVIQPTGITLNFLFWVPVSGLVASALPVWRKGEAREAQLSRYIYTMTLLVAVIVPVLGILPMPASL